MKPYQLLNAFACCFLAVATARAGSLTDYGAVPALTKPQGDQSAANQKLDFQTDLFTGRFAYHIPVTVTPGRQGSEPGVVLRYGSSGQNGWCGVGWDLDMGFIQRETRKGVPVSGSSYADSFGFTFSVAGQSGRLINVGTGDYRPQINPAFLKFAYSSGSWAVTDKSGRKYYFGETSASRVTNSYGTFKWALSSIRDPNGNKTLFTYASDSGQLYLQQIDYNANDNSPAIAANCSIAFDLESTNRPDILSSVSSGLEIKTAKRLGNIRVVSQGLLVRRYFLQYIQSPSTTRSLLQSVTEYGSDNVTSLPPHTFGYQVQSQSFGSLTYWPIVSQQSGSAYWDSPGTSDTQLVDINGDGLPDWVCRPLNQPYNNFQVQLNNGTSFGSTQSWSPVANETSATGADWNTLDSADSHLVDINGDSLPDRVMRQFYTPYTSFKVQLNSGTGFNSVSSWTGVSSQNTNYPSDTLNVPMLASSDGVSSSVILADINGDGLPDRIMVSSTSGRFDVQLNGTNGFFSGIVPWSGVVPSGTITDNYYAPRVRDLADVYSELMDVNGDGLADRIIKGGVQLNNGFNGFLSSQSWGLASTDYPGVLNTADGDYTTSLVDINGDGLPDLVTRTSSSTFTVRVNTGAGFSSTTKTWTGVSDGGYGTAGWDATHAWDANGTRVQFIDINGDGLVDRVLRYNSAGGGDDDLMVQLNAGPFPDLLSTINNGIGGSISVSYLPSTRYNNSDGTRPRLPFPVQTVSSVTVNDGRGNIGTTTYGYRGGYYDTTYREFRGFSVATNTDPLGAYTVTWFHQGGGTNGSALGEYNDDLAKAGMPYRVESYGSDGKLYSRNITRVNEVQLHSAGVFFPFTQQTIKEDFEGNSGYRATAVGYAFDVLSNNLAASTGNLLSQTNYGEVANVNISAHTFTTNVSGAPPPVFQQYLYATITSNPDIVDRVGIATVSADGAGSVVLQQTVNQYYAVTGDLKTKSELICPGTYAVTSYGYDVYGNVTSVTNPVGIVTTTGYDSARATYPVIKYTGALADNLIEYAQYGQRSGLIVCATNMQGLVTSNQYDAFFRLTNSMVSTTPFGTPNLWRVRIQYNFGGIAGDVSQNYVHAMKNDPADSVNGQHETYTYFDGLGRVIQARVEAETNGYRVSDLVYDARGSVILEGYPIFASGSAYAKPSGTRTDVFTEYDAIGRVFRVNPCASAGFDSHGWLSSITVLTGDSGSPVGSTSWAFQEGGANPWATIVTDARGKVRKSYHDAFRRTVQIVEVTSQGNYTTTLAYDSLGNLTNITDNAQNHTAFFYDSLGRKVAMADPDMGFWQYGLDAAGRLKVQTDAKGQQIKFFYNDPDGRVTRREGWNAAAQLVSTCTWQYDSNGGDSAYTVYPGQLFSVTDDEGWQKNSYDVRGRVQETVRYLSKNSNTYTTQFTFDDADRVTTMVYPNGGPTVANAYDTGGNLSQVHRVDGGGANITYYAPQGFDALGRLQGMNFGNGATTAFGYYNISKRLNQVATTIPGGAVIQNFTNRYDAVGNIVGIQDNVTGHTGAASATVSSAAYDDLNRLTNAAWAGYGTKSYSYDSVGNMSLNGESGSGTYAYNTIRPHTVKSANGVWYTYDQNGNAVFRGGQRLDYDVNNRLYRVISTNGTLTTFGYDANGARLWELSGTNSLQVWIGDAYEEKDGKVLYHIAAGGKRICTFEPAAGGVTGYDSSNQEFYYYHPDYLGSSSLMTERNGAQVQHYEYSAFGQDRYTQSTTAFSVSRRYTGQVLDEDTGLYYYNARYYDPQLGRFLQPDTLLQDLGDPQTYNPYSYCRNNPMRYTDPTGHGEQPADSPKVGFWDSFRMHSMILNAKITGEPQFYWHPGLEKVIDDQKRAEQAIKKAASVLESASPESQIKQLIKKDLASKKGDMILGDGPSDAEKALDKITDQLVDATVDAVADQGAKRPGTRGHPDHKADVEGPGREQAESQAKPGETVLTESPVQGYPDINRRADNQVVDPSGKTRVVVESERRPGGTYHQERVKELEKVGIEVQTRPVPAKKD